MNLQYVVVGTPRSGTVYCARLLTALGFMCGHESVFDYRGISHAADILRSGRPRTSHCSLNDRKSKNREKWFDPQKMVAESSYMATPFLNSDLLQGCKTIHAVRNPLKTVSSLVLDVKFLDFDNKSQTLWRNFVQGFLPEISSIRNEIERTCHFYVRWNKLAHGAGFRFHVENTNLEGFKNYLQTNRDAEVSKDINSWKARKKDLTLRDIPNGEIKDEFVSLIEEYGYPKDEKTRKIFV